MRNLTGNVLDGRYHLLELIGEGGMGHVFAAEHVTLRRRMAVKVLREELAVEPANVQRFLQEAQAASAINHPNVVEVTDFGQTAEGISYFVMEYLDGEELTALIHRANTLPWPSIQPIILQVVRGLQAAHDKGVVYRDLKPANVYLTKAVDGSLLVKLLDFGIAKHTNGPSGRPRTKPNSVFGTARYMSPEQAAGKDVDARSDIYATGVVLYEMLTGRAPFESDNYIEVVRCHLIEPIPRPRDVAPEAGIPDFVEDLVLKALEKDPANRYQDMTELEAAIRGAAMENTIASTALIPDEFDGADRTFIWDAEQGRVAREAASQSGRGREFDEVDATTIRPNPVNGPIDAGAMKLAGVGRSMREHTQHAGHAPSPPRPAGRVQKKTLIAGDLEPPVMGAPIPPPMQDEQQHFGRSFASPASSAPSPGGLFGSAGSGSPAHSAPQGPFAPSAAPAPMARPGDGAFFAQSTAGAGGMGGGSNAPVMPGAMALPTGGPSAHQTLPPVNWTPGAAPNPSTGAHSGPEQRPTEEFALRIPRHAQSRNLLVVFIAIAAVLFVGAGVAAWTVFFNDSAPLEDDVYPTVVAEQPKPISLSGGNGPDELKPIVVADTAGDGPPAELLGPRNSPPTTPERGGAVGPGPRNNDRSNDRVRDVVDEPEPTRKPRNTRPARNDKPRGNGSSKSGGSKSSGSSVRKGFNRAKKAIAACGNQHGAIGGTKFRVDFDVVGGRATNVKIQMPHSVTSLGRCVAKAVSSKAKFGSDTPGQQQYVSF